MSTNFLRGFIVAATLGASISSMAAVDFSTYAIFGEDNRQEIFSADQQWQWLSQAIAGKVSVEHIRGGTELLGSPLKRRTCPTNRFADQITVPTCSGFLAKPNILITAGHCFKTKEDCDNFVWVFGYALESETDQTYTRVTADRVYRCKKVVSRRYESFGAVDYAIIELDRPVLGREPLKLGFDVVLNPGMPVASIGHPSGLPQKLADGATILQLTDNDRTIETDLDMFQGNSGSPVFDASTGIVIGITSRGHADHVREPEKLCKIPKVCMPGDQCHWSASSRITNLKDEPVLQN